MINWPLNRLILSTGAALYAADHGHALHGSDKVADSCFRREVLAAIDPDGIHSNGYSFQIEMTHTAWHLGFKIAESLIVFEERREGQSKMSGGIVNEALWMVWKLLARCGWRRRPRVVHPQSVAAQAGGAA